MEDHRQAADAISPKWGIDAWNILLQTVKRSSHLNHCLERPKVRTSNAQSEYTDTRSGARRRAAVAPPASTVTQISDRIPLFQYHAPGMGPRRYGVISVGNGILHQIRDMGAFYRAMGHGQGERDKELCGDEFVWERYIRDGAPMSRQCLQVQIAAYLATHSEDFMNLYGAAYREMIGKCDSDDIDGGDSHCSQCPMHPSKRTEPSR